MTLSVLFVLQVGYDFLKEAYSVSSCQPYQPREEV